MGNPSAKPLVQQFLDWLQTPEGQAEIEKGKRIVHETELLLAKGRDIPWEKLHEPFTI